MRAGQRLSRAGRRTTVLALAVALSCLAGCGPEQGSDAGLEAFRAAGPVRTVADIERLIRAKISTGPYRVVVGDVLHVQIATLMRAISPEVPDAVNTQPYLCRVAPDGTIQLPIVGGVPAAGMTLTDIEFTIADAYHPKYYISRPTVSVRVAEHRTINVSVLGAVAQPGIHQLRSDQTSLVAALMKAGGILPDGASVIQLRHADESAEASGEPIVLPVKGLNVPFADVALQDGDTVEVKSLDPQVFTVIGLVNRVGAFPYPRGTRLTLLQALAYAGGLHDVADPQYCKIYRQDADGNMVAQTFKVTGTALTSASNVTIKPGDVVAVEHTGRTRARLILAEVLQIRAGINVNASASYSKVWDDSDSNDCRDNRWFSLVGR